MVPVPACLDIYSLAFSSTYLLANLETENSSSHYTKAAGVKVAQWMLFFV